MAISYVKKIQKIKLIFSILWKIAVRFEFFSPNYVSNHKSCRERNNLRDIAKFRLNREWNRNTIFSTILYKRKNLVLFRENVYRAHFTYHFPSNPCKTIFI